MESVKRLREFVDKGSRTQIAEYAQRLRLAGDVE